MANEKYKNLRILENRNSQETNQYLTRALREQLLIFNN